PLPPPTPDPQHRPNSEYDEATREHRVITSVDPEARPTPDRPEGADKPAKVEFSASQIVGGALAAMTAAALGSRLGVGGTIIGAAVASIIAAVAGTLYTASLRHTQEKVKTVWTGRVAGTNTPAAIDRVPETLTWDLPQAPVAASGAAKPPRAPRDKRGKLPWKAVVVTALATFAIAAVALTGFELLSGNALSGGNGTTIGRVSEPRKAATSPSKKATPTKSESATPSESETPSETPSVEPAPSASEAPETTEQPTPSASETPSQQAEEETAAPSETPSDLPSGAAGSASDPVETPAG
ncbi:MAG: hypothetical protein ABWX96_17305, partial [Propionibacteriaceae bacterium]